MFSRLAMHAGFVVSCLICILLAHYAAVLPHEYAHSFMAFALGYKSDPLVIHFGGTSVGNLTSLINIDEQVDYAPMFARGDGPAAALVVSAVALPPAAAERPPQCLPLHAGLLVQFHECRQLL
jgi:hypothetical protein